MLTFAYRNWDGRVPDPGELRPSDEAIIETVESGFQSVREQLEAVHLRAALAEALRLSTEVNRYLDQSAPWAEIKQDKSAAAKTIFTALRAIDSLKILFAPFLPFSSEQLNNYLGYDQPLFGVQFTENVSDELGEHTVLRYRNGNPDVKWIPSKLIAGQALREPAPLFRKLDLSVAAEERSRLG